MNDSVLASYIAFRDDWAEYAERHPVHAALAAETWRIGERLEFGYYQSLERRDRDFGKLIAINRWLAVPKRVKRKGRPPTESRKLAIFVLDARLTDPQMSWTKLPQKFCRCGKRTHSHKCVDRLRTQVRLLIKELKKWRITVDLSKADA
jgi:hypothetical protein